MASLVQDVWLGWEPRASRVLATGTDASLLSPAWPAAVAAWAEAAGTAARKGAP